MEERAGVGMLAQCCNACWQVDGVPLGAKRAGRMDMPRSIMNPSLHSPSFMTSSSWSRCPANQDFACVWGSSIYDVHKLLWFFIPPHVRKIYILFVHKLWVFPSPFCADVIYGSPLALLTRARGFRILTYHAERRGGNLGANKSVSCIARSRDRSVTKFQLSSVFLD